jgi:hypothetical protein
MIVQKHRGQSQGDHRSPVDEISQPGQRFPREGFKVILLVLGVFVFTAASYAQWQTCPANINYATGDLSFWGAKTGLVSRNTISYPAPNAGGLFAKTTPGNNTTADKPKPFPY